MNHQRISHLHFNSLFKDAVSTAAVFQRQMLQGNVTVVKLGNTGDKATVARFKTLPYWHYPGETEENRETSQVR